MKNAWFNSSILFSDIKNASIALLIFVFLGFYPSDASAQAGSFDDSFHPGLEDEGSVRSLLVLPNDKILIGGRFSVYDGFDRNNLVKVEANGEIDNSFSIGSGIYENDLLIINAIKHSGYGGYYIGGGFDSYNGVERPNIFRIHSDGLLDTSFDPGSGPSNAVSDIALHTGNKIWVGSYGPHYDGHTNASAGGICRVMPDGSLDQTFVSLSSLGFLTDCIYVDNNNYTYLGGNYHSWDGQPMRSIIKLLPNGDIDPNFPNSECNAWIKKVLPSGDGNLYIIGNFTQCYGVATNKIAKITPQGDLIYSFDVGAGINYYAYDALVQNDGKLIVVGDFTTFNGEPASKIVRIMPDGSIDPTFVSGIGANATILTCALQSDGKIIIGGNFSEYDGNSAYRIARLHNDIATNTTKVNAGSPYGIYPNPASQSCSISGNESNKALNVNVLDMQGRVVKSLTTFKDIDTSDLVNGLYVVQIFEGEHFTNIKLVVN